MFCLRLAPVINPLGANLTKWSSTLKQFVVKSFHSTGLFLYPLTIKEDLWFRDDFRKYKKKPAA